MFAGKFGALLRGFCGCIFYDVSRRSLNTLYVMWGALSFLRLLWKDFLCVVDEGFNTFRVGGIHDIY